MLHIERSNRTEALLDGLAERLMRPRGNPLAPSVVVVQGQGMERWVAQSIARDHGVCANTRFLFPRRFLEQVFERALPTGTDVSQSPANPAWGVDHLVWAIAAQIESNEDAPELVRLARQLETPDRDWRRIQLAARVARLFDDYITYRPDWVTRWARGEVADPAAPEDPDELWQRFLFRALVEKLGPGHLADCARWFRVRAGRADETELPRTLAESFPEGVEVFAVSTLPPLYVSILSDLARFVDVRLSVLSPSRAYWADLWGELQEEQGLVPTAARNSMHGLLAGLGRLGGDFQSTLENAATDVATDLERYDDGGTEAPLTLLSQLQRRMLDLDSPESESARPRIARGDRSIEIHRCHGAKRELEAVRSVIEEALANDATLRPEDIIVMAPRIDALAPLIEAVFSGSEERSLPHRVADRGALRRSPVAEAFVGLLALLGGRGERTQVLDWLTLEPVRSKLGLDVDETDALREWAERAGVRFGFDAAHRASLGLESSASHTWSAAIDRLVLGHAYGPSAEPRGGLAPAVPGRFLDASLLGGLGELQANLATARLESEQPRSVEGWARWLIRLLDAVVDRRDDNAHEHAILRASIGRIAAAAESADFERPIPFEAIRERLIESIEAAPPAEAFLSGGITFCELVPLRAIPFRVIAIVGLDDLAFPRRSAAPHFDLMARAPRAGDRTGRSDDRYLFLESLLSARDRLVLTVPGRDLRDGSAQPMSVVLSELLDVLDATFEVADSEQTPSERLVIDHPLQSHSPRYFEAGKDERLRGLDEEAFVGAQRRLEVLGSAQESTWRFLAEAAGETLVLDGVSASAERASANSLDAPAPPEIGVLSLEDLIARMLSSTRTFARDRLAVRMPRPERAVSNFDPEDLDALDLYSIGSALLSKRQAGASRARIKQHVAASTRLPDGEPGRLAAASLVSEVERLVAIAAERGVETAPTESSFSLVLDVTIGRPDGESAVAVRLAGQLPEVVGDARLQVGMGRLGRRAELAFWITHLAGCAVDVSRGEPARQSILIGRPEQSDAQDRVVVFEPVSDAREELARLVGWVARADAAPLRFFPKASRAFAIRMRRGEVERAWREAQHAFYGGEGGEFDRPEIEDDLELALVWAGARPLEEPPSRDPETLAFDVLAERFFERYLESRKVCAR